MSLEHSPEGPTSRPVLQSCAEAIRALEKVTGSFKTHKATKEDTDAVFRSVRELWSVLENNGYTIDVDTNRLRKQEGR